MAFVPAGWDPHPHRAGGLRGLPWLGMLPVVPSPEMGSGITGSPGRAPPEGTGGCWWGWFAHQCQPAPRARTSLRCPGGEQPGHPLPLAVGKEDLHNKPPGWAAAPRAAERSRWMGRERIKLSPEGGTARPGGRGRCGVGEPQGWGAACWVPAGDTWVLLRSQRWVLANQPGPLAHWSMATSRSSMSTRTTPLGRGVRSSPEAAWGLPVPPTQCGWCWCTGYWGNVRCQGHPQTPAGDCPPSEPHLGEAGAGAGAGKGQGQPLLGVNSTSRGALTQPRKRGAAGVAPACHPAGPTLFPWVLRGGRGFPLGNGAMAPPLARTQLPPSLPSASRCGSSRRCCWGAAGTHQPRDNTQLPGGTPAGLSHPPAQLWWGALRWRLEVGDAG